MNAYATVQLVAQAFLPVWILEVALFQCAPRRQVKSIRAR
jgi:hypothetical protein